MREEMESMWQAMKGSHYQRVLDGLRESVRGTRDLKAALTASLESVVKAMHAETGTFWFYERFKDKRIYPRAVYGGADLSGVVLQPGEGIAGQVIKNAKAVIIRDCQADPRWAGRVDKKTGFQTKSMICVPLMAGKWCYGSIQIINQVNGLLFDEKDLSFAEVLAGEISKLLGHQGLLEEYSADLELEERREFSFREWMLEGSPEEMERLLYTVPEFAKLSHRDQQAVLQLSKQIRQYFTRRRR